MALKDKAAAVKEEQVEEKSKVETAPAVRAQTQVSATPATLEKGSAFITNPAIVEAATGASYGTYKSVVASQGTHMVSGDEVDLGKILKFQAILVVELKKVIPGSTDDEAKEFFKVSYDGETTSDGQSLSEALEDAKAAGYDRASIKDYLDVICIITDCENSDFIGETVTLQLAPSSRRNWLPLAGRCKMKAALGGLKTEPVMGDPSIDSAVVFTSKAKPTSYKGNNYTVFEFSI